MTPLPWLTLKAGGWLPVASNNKMYDYDWLVAPIDEWSDLSQHENTRMTQAHMVDLGIGVRVFNFTRPDPDGLRAVSLQVLGGYRWLNMRFEAKGGSFIYSGGGGFRNNIGNFPADQMVITYEQWFNTPYIGLGLNTSYGRWTLSGEVTGSWWANANDLDNHVMRTTEFRDSFSKVGMLGLNARVDYALSEQFSLFGRIDHLRFYDARGPSNAYDYSAGTLTETTGEAAGAGHYSTVVSVGLKAALR